MKEKETAREALAQNLRDAGCGGEMIERYLSLDPERSSREREMLLKRHRAALLNAIHAEQKKLDCLDYLLYTTGEKKRRKSK